MKVMKASENAPNASWPELSGHVQTQCEVTGTGDGLVDDTPAKPAGRLGDVPTSGHRLHACHSHVRTSGHRGGHECMRMRQRDDIIGTPASCLQLSDDLVCDVPSEDQHGVGAALAQHVHRLDRDPVTRD